MVVHFLAQSVSDFFYYSQEGGEFTMKSESLVKTSEIKFKLGEEFDEVTGDGRKVKSTMSLVAPNTILVCLEFFLPLK